MNGMNKRAVYVGTSAYTLHKRISEHMQDVIDKRIDASAMSKHMIECHNDMEPIIKAKIVATYNMTLKRYISEALHLLRMKKMNNNILNLRGEWGKVRLPRLQVSNNERRDDMIS